MSGFPLILAFVAAIVLMILAISKWKIHPFLSIMGISLVLGLVAGVPLVNRTAADGAVTPGLANVIGSGFSGTFTSIGIVIILGALIGTILEATGAALKLADMVIRVVGKKRPELAVLLMGWVVSIPVFCDSGFVILNPIRKALVKRTMTSSRAVYLSRIHSAYAGAHCRGQHAGHRRQPAARYGHGRAVLHHSPVCGLLLRKIHRQKGKSGR